MKYLLPAVHLMATEKSSFAACRAASFVFIYQLHHSTSNPFFVLISLCITFRGACLLLSQCAFTIPLLPQVRVRISEIVYKLITMEANVF